MRDSASFTTSELASNLRADLDIMKNLSRYQATFAFLLGYYKADLDTLEQLFMYLVTLVRLRMSKNKNIFKNIDQAENLWEIRNKKQLSLIDLIS